MAASSGTLVAKLCDGGTNAGDCCTTPTLRKASGNTLELGSLVTFSTIPELGDCSQFQAANFKRVVLKYDGRDSWLGESLSIATMDGLTHQCNPARGKFPVSVGDEQEGEFVCNDQRPCETDEPAFH